MAGRLVRTLAVIGLVAVLLGAWWWLRPVQATVSVYFVRGEGPSSTLQEAGRIARGRGAQTLLAAAIHELLAGPTPEERRAGLTTAIPAGTRLRSLHVEDGVVIVDLSGEVESGGGSSSMLGRLWQIVYTATQFPQTPRVRILIDGQAKDAMGGEGVLIDRPLRRPPALPQF